MSEPQKQLKIAEACGWEWLSRSDDGLSWLFPKGAKIHKGFLGDVYGPKFIPETPEGRRCGFGSSPPKYFSDLNACAEMEKSLVGINQTLAYQDCLTSIMKTWDACPFLIFAPAWAKAEAFGLTLGLWKEGE